MEWQKGTPEKPGYYLGAWRFSPQRVVVSELWFNPDAIYLWWFGRGYANQRSEGMNDALQQEVLAWMPLPDPPPDI